MKIKPVVTRHQADNDIDRAFEFYLVEGGRDVAIAFIDEYEKSTSHLSRFPLSGSPQLEHKLAIPDLSQWPMRRFPYVIVYFDREHSVEIWRILHGHMDLPAWLQEE